MKKLLSLLLVLSMLLPLCCAAANADAEPEAFISGDYKYTLNEDGTVCITVYFGEAETLEIPETLDGKSVTGIGDYAFFECISLTGITIPDSVIEIGDWAFNYCKNLTLYVPYGSYAEQYAKENGIPYEYSDEPDLSWLELIIGFSPAR